MLFKMSEKQHFRGVSGQLCTGTVHCMGMLWSHDLLMIIMQLAQRHTVQCSVFCTILYYTVQRSELGTCKETLSSKDALKNKNVSILTTSSKQSMNTVDFHFVMILWFKKDKKNKKSSWV